jgi:membrane protein YdbS with pleckstrin-like domain
MKQLLLSVLRVPPEPHPPAGSPESIRIFRAAPNYYYWNLFHWVLAQIVAVAIFVSIATAVWKASEKFTPTMRSVASVVEGIGAVLFLLQIPISFIKQRLDYDLRWYIVTDRSLRIRSGIWSVQEMTMTFANLQKVSVSQGPLQKILGLFTVEASSAGGGAAEPGKQGHGINRHTARFEGVDNARQIRDLIQDRVRKYRDAGLGDPDDGPHVDQHDLRPDSEALTAAQEVLAEVRKLRSSL